MTKREVKFGTRRMKRLTACTAVFIALFSLYTLAQAADTRTTEAVWYFAVSGDSRNCGDIVMPAIAEKVLADKAVFYWHLGDFRAINDFDQDYRQTQPKATIAAYQSGAWPDFIEQQLGPFGNLPVYLVLGNHETTPPKTRAELLAQFADWFASPVLTAQRLRDDPHDHVLKTYYHWIERGVDFVTLDNASSEQFDDAQLRWFAGVIQRAAQDLAIKSVVVGMHAALPDSLAIGHSMNDSAQGTMSGRSVYRRLLEFRRQTHKQVYVLASHSHFVMDNVYATTCRRGNPETILPGWIVGTAGAVRYRLPDDTGGANIARTDVYGYLLATVSATGDIQFQFKEVKPEDVPEATRQKYSEGLVRSCFQENAAQNVHQGPVQPPSCP